MFLVCIILFDSIPNKCAKVDERFQGYEDRNLKLYEFEKLKTHNSLWCYGYW